MKAYLVRTSKLVEPFDDEARDSLILNKPLSEWQDEALRELGIPSETIADGAAIDDSDEYLVIEDRLFFSAELLRDFVKESQAAQSPTRCAIKRDETTKAG